MESHGVLQSPNGVGLFGDQRRASHEAKFEQRANGLLAWNVQTMGRQKLTDFESKTVAGLVRMKMNVLCWFGENLSGNRWLKIK